MGYVHKCNGPIFPDLHPSFKNRWLMQSQGHPEGQKRPLRGHSTEIPNPVAVAGEALLAVQRAILSSSEVR
jgi:hypothetical protein